MKCICPYVTAKIAIANAAILHILRSLLSDIVSIRTTGRVKTAQTSQSSNVDFRAAGYGGGGLRPSFQSHGWVTNWKPRAKQWPSSLLTHTGVPCVFTRFLSSEMQPAICYISELTTECCVYLVGDLPCVLSSKMSGNDRRGREFEFWNRGITDLSARAL